MSNTSLLIRTVIIYAICLPLAIILGYILASPTDYMMLGEQPLPVNLVVMLAVLGFLMLPMLLRWHYPWLIACWNLGAMVFVLPGRPMIGFVMCGVSFGISFLQHTLNKNYKFLDVPSINWPLYFITAVILITARLTGGIGLAVAGGSSIGGKKYLSPLVAILGYFALTAHRIPPRRAVLYIALFYLSAITAALTNLAGSLGPSLSFIYLVFPIDNTGMEALRPDLVSTGPADMIERLGGVSIAATAVFSALLAIYGIRGLFRIDGFWRCVRLALFIFSGVGALFGGFRSVLIMLIITFALVYWFEGLMRSQFTPAFVLTGILGAALILPFASKLNPSVQRTISFIPFVKVDPRVEDSAQASTDWRLEMWSYVIPEIPKYLLIGKGYSIDPTELGMLRNNMTKGAEVGEGSALSSDFHSGPLSVIIPFGIFGVIGFLWLIWSGTKVLHRNYLYGDPKFYRINTFLLASFIGKFIFFLFVFGSFEGDLFGFTGILGLSVALNGGVRSPVPAPSQSQAQDKLRLPRMAGAYANGAR